LRISPIPCRRLRNAEVIKMLKTLLKTSSSKKATIDPEGLHATIIIAWKTSSYSVDSKQKN
jgi:hypothetical protein